MSFGKQGKRAGARETSNHGTAGPSDARRGGTTAERADLSKRRPPGFARCGSAKASLGASRGQSISGARLVRRRRLGLTHHRQRHCPRRRWLRDATALPPFEATEWPLMADKPKANSTKSLLRLPRFVRGIAEGDGPIGSAAGKYRTARPMGMQPRRKGDIIPASDTRRDSPGAHGPRALP
jgi:hypothetical protein